MASLTRWTWAWASSGRWWWTGKPGVLMSTGSQRVRHDWATEQQQYMTYITNKDYYIAQGTILCRNYIVITYKGKKSEKVCLYMYIHACILSCLSCVQLCVMLWTAHQGSLPMGIPQTRILEWVAMSSSRGSSWLRNQTHVSSVSCTGMWVPYHYHHLGSLNIYTYVCVCVCIYKSTILQLKIKRIKSHDFKTLLDNLGHILTTGCLYLLGFWWAKRC